MDPNWRQLLLAEAAKGGSRWQSPIMRVASISEYARYIQLLNSRWKFGDKVQASRFPDNAKWMRPCQIRNRFGFENFAITVFETRR
jgi:hypothetical protein